MLSAATCTLEAQISTFSITAFAVRNTGGPENTVSAPCVPVVVESGKWIREGCAIPESLVTSCVAGPALLSHPINRSMIAKPSRTSDRMLAVIEQANLPPISMFLGGR